MKHDIKTRFLLNQSVKQMKGTNLIRTFACQYIVIKCY